MVESTGVHRFTITLGAAPAGEMYVDERGSAYLGLTNGKVIGVTAQGQKFFAFQTPKGVRGNLAFADGQGLLFSGTDEVVIGLNRGGFPTLRMKTHAKVTAGPIGVSGWCVVATSGGEIEWGNRWGKRRHLTLGVEVSDLQSTSVGGLWALTDQGLMSIARDRTIAHQRSLVEAMATASSTLRDRGIEGVLLTRDGRLDWIDSAGRSIRSVALEDRDRAVGTAAHREVGLRLDDNAGVWIATIDGRVLVGHPSGELKEVGALPGTAVFAPIIDNVRHRVLVATLSGEVFAVDWPNWPQAWQQPSQGPG